MSSLVSGFGTLQPGTVIGKCEIIEPIGRGGMGVVYRALHRTLQIDVAVKVISFSAGTEDEQAALVQRFFREARAAARIRHENVISVFDVDEQDRLYYMVMELIEGGSSARRLLDRGPVDPREAARVARDTARALGAAHAFGIVHRDIKPENILLTTDNRVKIGDFGIAAVRTEGGDGEAARLTQTGQVVGTPHYMSPEQVNGAPVDGRADIYSLGATLYHILTGTFPFFGTSAFQVCMKHVMEPLEPPRMRLDTIPPMLEEIVVRMMAKRPDERPQTAGAVAESLDAFLRSAGTTDLEAMADQITLSGVGRGVVVVPSGALETAAPPSSLTPPAPKAISDADREAQTSATLPRDDLVLAPLSENVTEGGTLVDAVRPAGGAAPLRPSPAPPAAPSWRGAGSGVNTPGPWSLSAAPANLTGVGRPGPATPPLLPPPAWPPLTQGKAAGDKDTPRKLLPGAETAGLGSTSGGYAVGSASGGYVIGAASARDSVTPVPARPAVPPPAPRRERERRERPLVLLFLLALLGGALYLGYREGLHERYLKPAFLRFGIPWPAAVGPQPRRVPGSGPTAPADAGRFARGLELLRANDLTGALEAFERVIAAPAEDEAARGELVLALSKAADILESTGRYPEAYAHAQRILDHRDAPGALLVRTAEQLERLGARLPPPPVTFAVRTFVACRIEADRLSLGDIDGDGRPDLAVLGPEDGLLLLTRGAGGEYNLMRQVDAEDRIDVDGDGRPDRIMGIDPADPSGASRPIRTSRALFGEAAAGKEPAHLDLVDLAGDGVPDLVFSTPGLSELFLRARGADRVPGPVQKLDLGGALVALAVGRVAASGREQLAALAAAPVPEGEPPAYRVVGWSLDERSGVIARTVAVDGIRVAGVLALGDLSGDGAADLVATAPDDPSGKRLAIFRSKGGGDFAREAADLALDFAPSAIRLVDLDGDGRPDVFAIQNTGSGTVIRTYRAEPGGGFRAVANIDLPSLADVRALVVGDLDRDGRADAALCDFQRGVAIVYGDGRGGLAASRVGPGPR